MNAADPNVQSVELVAHALGELCNELVLVGGCAASLLMDAPTAPPPRVTYDVDLLVVVTVLRNYHVLEEKFVQRGFMRDMSPEAPICRWRIGEVVVDLMPTDETVLGFSNRWYPHAAATAVPTVLPSGRAIHLQLQVRPGSDAAKRQEVLDAWYRQQLRDALPALLARWEPLMGVKAKRIFVQRMKTKWGSCNPASAAIRLNTDLAKKPPECLEYIVVHELAHLIEPTHNARFIAAMDRFMPKWRHFKDQLNRLPIRHEDWRY